MILSFLVLGREIFNNQSHIQTVTYRGTTEYTPGTHIELKGAKRTSAEHDVIYGASKFPYILDFRAGKGRLIFIGVKHTYDPTDPQLKIIKEMWHQAKPDVALVESRVSAYKGNPEDVAKRGEPYFVLALARTHGVDIFSLEPSALAEGNALAKAESKERALLFLVIRGYQSYMRTNSEMSDFMVNIMIARRSIEYGLECDLKTVADLEAMWKKDFPQKGAWREIEERATWPGKEITYLNRLSNVSNDVRDEHWAKTMVDLVRKGKTVFAVGGASHVINLEPVLRVTLESDNHDPIKGSF